MITLVAFLITLLVLTLLAWCSEARQRRIAERQLKRAVNEGDRLFGELEDARRSLRILVSRFPERTAQGRFAKRC